MTVVGISSPVSLIVEWSQKHLGTNAQVPSTIGKGDDDGKKKMKGWVASNQLSLLDGFIV